MIEADIYFLYRMDPEFNAQIHSDSMNYILWFVANAYEAYGSMFN